MSVPPREGDMSAVQEHRRTGRVWRWVSVAAFAAWVPLAVVHLPFAGIIGGGALVAWVISAEQLSWADGWEACERGRVSDSAARNISEEDR